MNTGDVAYARGLFADQKSFDGYVDSLKISGNLDAIARSSFITSVSLPVTKEITSTKGADDIWTVKFPARITYSKERDLDDCLSVTMRVKETASQLGIVNIISAQGRGCAP